VTGRPPTAVASHVARWTADEIVCPCPQGDRDPRWSQRRRRARR
jgi:hypothetical protein